MMEQRATGIQRAGKELRVAEVLTDGRKITILRLDRWEPGPAPPPGPTEKGNGQGNGNGKGNGTVPALTIASVPTRDVLTRVWTLPHADKNQFRSILAHRVEADLPVPIEELTWGYRVTENTQPGDGEDLFLVQAVKSTQADRHLSDLAHAGFEADILTTEAEAVGALYRYGLNLPAGPGSDGLILAGSDEWLVAVLTDGLVRSLRRFKIAGDSFAPALLEIRHALGTDPAGRLRRVLWCASADLAITPERVRELSGLTVTPVEWSDRLCSGPEISPAESDMPRFGPALGLALAGVFEKDKLIRLVSREKPQISGRKEKIQKLLRHPLRWTAAALVLLVLAATIHVAAIGVENRKMRMLLSPLEKGDGPIAALEPRMQAFQRLGKYRVDALGVILDICRALPESIVIHSIQLSREQKLVVKGTSKDPKAVFGFADTLRKSNRLAAINPERTEPGQGGGFTVTAQLLGAQKISTIGERGARWK